MGSVFNGGKYKMKVIIDRFEGEYAVCEKENLDMIDIEIERLPEGVKEGDILIIEDNNIRIDKDETENRRKRIEELMNDLLE